MTWVASQSVCIEFTIDYCWYFFVCVWACDTIGPSCVRLPVFRGTSRHLWLSSDGHRGSFSHSVYDNEGETRNALKSFPFSSPFSSVSLYHSFFTGIMTSLLHTSQFLLHCFICDYGCNDSFFFLFRWFSVMFMNTPCSQSCCLKRFCTVIHRQGLLFWHNDGMMCRFLSNTYK